MCELVMHGVGGRTIREARQRLSYAEVVTWARYIRKRGSLNTALRAEVGFGQLLAAIHNAMGSKAKPEDFMPHIDKQAPNALTPEAVMRQLSHVAPDE